MANRVIVAVFATQDHAYDAARHIQNLDKPTRLPARPFCRSRRLHSYVSNTWKELGR